MEGRGVRGNWCSSQTEMGKMEMEVRDERGGGRVIFCQRRRRKEDEELLKSEDTSLSHPCKVIVFSDLHTHKKASSYHFPSLTCHRLLCFVIFEGIM